jgi:hypothetical protein
MNFLDILLASDVRVQVNGVDQTNPISTLNLVGPTTSIDGPNRVVTIDTTRTVESVTAGKLDVNVVSVAPGGFPANKTFFHQHTEVWRPTLQFGNPVAYSIVVPWSKICTGDVAGSMNVCASACVTLEVSGVFATGVNGTAKWMAPLLRSVGDDWLAPQTPNMQLITAAVSGACAYSVTCNVITYNSELVIILTVTLDVGSESGMATATVTVNGGGLYGS